MARTEVSAHELDFVCVLARDPRGTRPCFWPPQGFSPSGHATGASMPPTPAPQKAHLQRRVLVRCEQRERRCRRHEKVIPGRVAVRATREARMPVICRLYVMGASGRIGACAASERGECDGPGATPECVLLLVVRHADDAVAAHEVDDRPAGPQEDDLHGRVVAFAGVGGRGGAGREMKRQAALGDTRACAQSSACVFYACKPARTHAHSRTHARTRARTRTHARARTHACMHARTHARTHTYTHTHRGTRPAHSETKWVKRSR